MSTFKIAAVQIRYGKKESKLLDSIKKYISQASAKGVKIICFPEDTLCSGPKRNKVLLEQIQESCKEHKIWVILSAHLKRQKYTYNEAILINDKGEKVGSHKKVHVYDHPHVHPGTKFNIFKTPFCKIGLAICWDISCPESIQEMAKKGAKIIFCPMYWCYEIWAHDRQHKNFEKQLLQSLILTRAFENQVYFVFCNPCDSAEPALIQYTVISEPHKILKEIYNREGMIISKIDLNHIERIRKKYRDRCEWDIAKKS